MLCQYVQITLILENCDVLDLSFLELPFVPLGYTLTCMTQVMLFRERASWGYPSLLTGIQSIPRPRKL